MKKIILSGGGTGGHIYPAVAVAEALQAKYGDDVELLFVGAEGKMEMERVPALGYRIVGLPIAGLQRRLDFRNLLLPFKVWRSISRAKDIIRSFKPDIVVGFGGYASAPITWAANKLRVPTVLQEQNSFAGMTNRISARGASCVCVAYDGMQKFFPQSRIVMTGNPLRGNFTSAGAAKEEALKYFGLDKGRKVILVVGGSLGTRTLNNMMCRWIEQNDNPTVQVIWQTGRFYEREMQEFLAENPRRGIWQGAYLDRMDLAYAAADVVISRSGACTVSELCLMGKATVFVPSPNVAEDHQTQNAMALVDKDAALMVSDKDATRQAMDVAIETIENDIARRRLENNIKLFAYPEAAKTIVDEIEKIMQENEK